jgi:phosphatidate cytidylyltransferase
MKKRAITGFFFVIVMLGSVLLGGAAFLIFFAVLGLLCLEEFYRLVSSDEVRPNSVGGLFLGLAIAAAVGFHLYSGADLRVLLVAVPVFFALCILQLYRKSERPFTDLAYTLLGVLLTVVPLCFFSASSMLYSAYDFRVPLGMLLLLWASDTGAYLVGIRFGKTKLFERHSPKKTWEGLFGGLFSSLLVAFILGTQFTVLPLVHWAVISVITVIFGTYGDLVESMLKRSMDKKDSGTLLPGHGGLLDRFDGLFFSAPLVFVYLSIVLNF